MAAYHVFVDGAHDQTAAGLERLATAMAGHYGLPVAELRTRIATGRFRVKGNCDRATADMYVSDLTRLGARCSIEEASEANRANTPLPFPAVRPPTPSPLASTTPRPATSSMGQYQSGLSAAFSGASPAASLGALEGTDEAAFTLASVDGVDDGSGPSERTFEPPSSAALPASIGPAIARTATTKPAKPAKPKDEPLDMFAPPDAESAQLEVDLAPDEIERSAKKRSTAPPATVPIEETSAPAASSPAMRRSQPSIQPFQSDASRAPSGLAEPKTRFAVGVVLAIVLGFVPAHLIASMREKSAYGSVDTKVIEQQRDADTPDAYAALDRFRTEQLGRKNDDRRNIAILAFLIWGVAGAGVAYVWFRRIPWDRFVESGR